MDRSKKSKNTPVYISFKSTIIWGFLEIWFPGMGSFSSPYPFTTERRYEPCPKAGPKKKKASQIGKPFIGTNRKIRLLHFAPTND